MNQTFVIEDCFCKAPTWMLLKEWPVIEIFMFWGHLPYVFLIMSDSCLTKSKRPRYPLITLP